MPIFPNVRLVAAIGAGKAAGLASRVLHAGGGTTLPGLVARRIAPDTLRLLSAKLPGGVIVIGGTNGKTTTTRMIATLLSAAGRRVLHNRAGANLVTGLTTTVLAGSTLAGHLHADTALFETDEAALPQALAETQPSLVVLHNLFRDQLDRYGEVDTIASKWRGALEQLPASATVLLNADDPAVAALGEGLQARVCYYGLEDLRQSGGGATHFADSQFCRRCGARYTYSALFYAHIGHYVCPNCGHRRPTPDFRLERLDLDGTAASRLFIAFPAGYAGIHDSSDSVDWSQPNDAQPAAATGYLEIRLPLPGLYNALNALAAAAAGLLLGVAPQRIRDTLETFSAAFGRIERIDAHGKPLFMALIKNPVGASETVRMLTSSVVSGPLSVAENHTGLAPSIVSSQLPVTENHGQRTTDNGLHLLVAINDKYADGTDVSWLWDADFERLAGHVAGAVVSGTRAADMAVRLKYAGIDPTLIVAEPDLARALDLALERLPAGATLYTLPTYTAMLELRAELVRRGWAKPFWED